MPEHSVSVAGIVVDQAQRVLAIQRADNGEWQPPGGVLEHGETIEHGVMREVREETGVRVSVGRLTGVYKNMPRHVVALVFRCTPGNEIPRPTDEAVAVRWLHLDEVARLMTPTFAVRVTDAFRSGPPAVRVHDGVRVL